MLYILPILFINNKAEVSFDVISLVFIFLKNTFFPKLSNKIWSLGVCKLLEEDI